jgi:hypothetical protein
LAALTPSLSRSRERVIERAISRKGAKHVLREVEGGAKEKTEDEYSMED